MDNSKLLRAFFSNFNFFISTMIRDVSSLSKDVFDIVVIGGGIYGAWTALDASLRGLSVALLDKKDFGSETSSNTLKLIHGGLRYLQQVDFRRMRQSIRERTTLMRVAPHLIHPIPFVIPTYGHMMRGKELMYLALLINDIIGFDRNNLEDSTKHIPRGRVISRDECVRLFPGVDQNGLTGGAVWYDCQMYNSERLLLSILKSAEKKGATVANYVEVEGFLSDGRRVRGVRAKDILSGEKLDVHAQVVVNATGPWVDEVLGFLGNTSKQGRILLSKAMNIVVKRQFNPNCAIGVSTPFEFEDEDNIINKGSRLLFIVPWRSYSMIGTAHVPYEDDPSTFRVTREDVINFLDEVNRAYPPACLRVEDVSFVHGGLIPRDGSNNADVRVTKKYQILDHLTEDKIEGLISVVGVKYTTARDVAEKTVDSAFRKLSRESPQCLTSTRPVHGGHIERFNNFLCRELGRKKNGLDSEVIRHLIYNYGSQYSQILEYIDENHEWRQRVSPETEVIKAEVVRGVREEMAQKLSDVVFRRTELGSAGDPGDEALRICADLMARELDWCEARIQKELDEVKSTYSY